MLLVLLEIALGWFLGSLLRWISPQLKIKKVFAILALVPVALAAVIFQVIVLGLSGGSQFAGPLVLGIYIGLPIAGSKYDPTKDSNAPDAESDLEQFKGSFSAYFDNPSELRNLLRRLTADERDECWKLARDVRIRLGELDSEGHDASAQDESALDIFRRADAEDLEK
jgi:hypothetical protein